MQCCDSYSAPGEGAYLIDETSIYNTIPVRNIIKLATVLQDISSQWLSKMLSNQVQIWEINLNADDAKLHYSSVVALLEELDQAYIWMVDDG